MSRDLSVLHPKLQDAIARLSAAFGALGFPLIVTYTTRTVKEQQELFAQGRTSPGPIVTHCDGITTLSNHQPQADGFGHAVDIAFLKDGTVSWDPKLPWKAFGECAKALGLTWGGDFKSLPDNPHIELK